MSWPDLRPAMMLGSRLRVGSRLPRVKAGKREAGAVLKKFLDSATLFL